MFRIVAIILLLAGSVFSAEPLARLGDTAIVPADAATAAKWLGQADRFTRALSRFDRQSRLQTEREVSDAEFLRFASKAALDWKEDELQRLKTAWAEVAKRWSKYRPPLPKTIHLIKTSGREEGAAAYCRGAAIILPQSKLRGNARKLQRLLTHELFHILSSSQPDLRKKLYAVVGFQTLPPLSLPPELAPRKLTNPDAPLIDCRLTLKQEGGSLHLAPVLLASAKNYDAKKGGSFFRYLQFRMMEIEPAQGAAWRAKLKDGEPILRNVKELPEYFEKIGRNTNYIIHPDEVLADNFVFLLWGDKDLKTPRILEDMEKILKASAVGAD